MQQTTRYKKEWEQSRKPRKREYPQTSGVTGNGHFPTLIKYKWIQLLFLVILNSCSHQFQVRPQLLQPLLQSSHLLNFGAAFNLAFTTSASNIPRNAAASILFPKMGPFLPPFLLSCCWDSSCSGLHKKSLQRSIKLCSSSDPNQMRFWFVCNMRKSIFPKLKQ